MIENWKEISVESLKLVLSEGKERFSEVLSESETLTNRAEKFLTAIVALASFFSASFFANAKTHNYFDWIFGLLMIGVTLYCFYNSISLLKPKNVIYKGVKPERYDFDFLAREDVESLKAALTYTIHIVDSNIEHMRNKNLDRVEYYSSCLYSLLTAFFITTLYLTKVFVF